MRAVLETLASELRRLKAAGVRTVPVSDESLAELRRLVAVRNTGKRIPASAEATAGGPATGKSELTQDAEIPRSASETEAAIRLPVSGIPNSEPVSHLREPAARSSSFPPAPEIVLPPGDKATRWAALRELVLNHPVCRAHVRPGRQIVLGVGNLEAKIMFVGEAPGAEEEQQGEPFVGPAGQLLTRMIKGMGLERGDVYIGNIMNWRPELPGRGDGVQVGNREPSADEMAFCLPFLTAQVEVVNPALLVALGATAARGLLGAHAFKTLREARGRWYDYRGRPLRITYHPSYLLRREAEGAAAAKRSKRDVWEDLLAVMERAGLPVSDKQRNYYRS
jgi:DNA polymerase